MGSGWFFSYPSEGYLRHWRVQAGGFARHSLCWCFDLARPAFWKPFGGLWGLFLASFFYPSEGYLRHYLLFFSTRDRFIGLAAQALSRTAAQTVLTVVLPPPPPPNLFTGGRREGAVALKYAIECAWKNDLSILERSISTSWQRSRTFKGSCSSVRLWPLFSQDFIKAGRVGKSFDGPKNDRRSTGLQRTHD